MNCPNLKEIFADKFRVTIEPGAESRSDPWYFMIPCRLGHIAPWAPNTLVACTDRRGSTITKLMELPTATLVQDASDGANITFDISHADLAFAIMGPRRRKRLSPEHQAKLIEAGRRTRIKPGVQSDLNAKTIAPTTMADHPVT